MITFSLVIPVLGACEWLSETLESIRSQTFPLDDLETIIVTNGSSEQSVAGARTFLERHGIRAVVVIEANCNANAARNRGWQLAAGDWVIFLDAGDLLAPSKLELQAG